MPPLHGKQSYRGTEPSSASTSLTAANLPNFKTELECARLCHNGYDYDIMIMIISQCTAVKISAYKRVLKRTFLWGLFARDGTNIFIW